MHRRGAAGGFGGQRALPVRGLRQLDAYLQIREFREMARYRVGERQPAPFEQHHRRRDGDRLGHGRNAEYAVQMHRAAALPIAKAERRPIGRTAVSQDHHHRSRDDAGVDIRAEAVGQSLQPRS